MFVDLLRRVLPEQLRWLISGLVRCLFERLLQRRKRVQLHTVQVDLQRRLASVELRWRVGGQLRRL
jgi:hypothetical protein